MRTHVFAPITSVFLLFPLTACDPAAGSAADLAGDPGADGRAGGNVVAEGGEDTGCDTGGGEVTTGWMTGGGSLFLCEDHRVTHGFVLHCDPADGPNNLEINWHDDVGEHHFHLTDLTSVDCYDYPGQSPEHPAADFDTMDGWGTGRLDGVNGATVHFLFTDEGEPGTSDYAWIQIWDGQTQVLGVADYLTYGNQQAHSEK